MTDASQAATAPTKWGKLIRGAREASNLSIPEAARRSEGVSAQQWGNIERGYQWTGRGKTTRAPGTARTLAQMAAVVGVTPERLEQAGRSDAAVVLREIGVQAGQAADALPRLVIDNWDDENVRRLWELKVSVAQKLSLIEAYLRGREPGSGRKRAAG